MLAAGSDDPVQPGLRSNVCSNILDPLDVVALDIPDAPGALDL